MGDYRSDAKISLLIENAFCFWLNSTILLLCMFPVISHILDKTGKGDWTVPITWDTKIYILDILFGVFITYLFKPLANARKVFRYRFYAIFFYPFAVLAYSYITDDFSKYLSVFSFSVIGICIQAYDLCRPININSEMLIKKTFNILLISVGITIGLIVYKSTGNVFSLISFWMLGVFGSIFIILRYISIPTKFIIWMLPLFIFIVTFISMNNNYINYAHYVFVLGPVIEVIYGHLHPFMLDIQYGAGLTGFLALYFKVTGVSFEGLQILLRILTFIQYILIYFIAVRIYFSHKIAFVTLLATLAFSFYYMVDMYYYPSNGFLRFGFVYLILFCYLLEDKFISKNISLFLICVIASMSAIWSFESAVFTLPALFFSEYINNNLRKFLAVFSACFVTVLAIYLYPYIADGKWPLLSRYYEYVLTYTNGGLDLIRIPLSKKTNFWWLFPLVYLFVLISIIAGKIKDRPVILLTTYGLAIFLYAVYRGNNPFSISIPFILLSVYIIINIPKLQILAKQILLSAVLGVFFVSNGIFSITSS